MSKVVGKAKSQYIFLNCGWLIFAVDDIELKFIVGERLTWLHEHKN